MLHGTVRFSVGTTLENVQAIELTEGQSYHISPRTIHRMEAVTDVDILEVSTPELDDVVRLEDRYGRS